MLAVHLPARARLPLVGCGRVLHRFEKTALIRSGKWYILLAADSWIEEGDRVLYLAVPTSSDLAKASLAASLDCLAWHALLAIQCTRLFTLAALTGIAVATAFS